MIITTYIVERIVRKNNIYYHYLEVYKSFNDREIGSKKIKTVD